MRSNDEAVSAKIATALRDESQQLFIPPIPVEYNIEERLAKLPNPMPKLQSKIIANAVLDGVRLDELTFGSKGETTFEGLWVGSQQAPLLAKVVTPTTFIGNRGQDRRTRSFGG